MPSPVSRRLLRRGLLASVAALVLAAGLVAFVLLHAPGNVSHPNVQFTQPTSTAPPPPKAPLVDNFQWPWYGYDSGRTRFFTATTRIRPPLHVGWRVYDGTLLEFPPVIYHTTMYVLGDNAVAKAIDVTNGRTLWQRSVGTLAAASPAVAAGQGIVVMPVLSVHRHRPGMGSFVALSMRTGHLVWSHWIPAGTESSPIVSGATAYFGDQGGSLWALSLHTGHVEWRFHAAGAIKGGPALSGGDLYFGDYAGHAYAVRASNGHKVWSAGTSGAHFGFGSGNFYATPAVAFGRVYMGNTDGRVYSFAAGNGALAWATGTGAYVYASAAIADPPGLGPTVYVGSYDGYLYAFNARSGAIRWRHRAGGKISGSSTVVGNVVYYSDLGNKTTTGLDATTGRTVFTFPDGAFTPVIADYHAIYLDGYNTIYQLLPGAAAAPHRPPPSKQTYKPAHKSVHKPARRPPAHTRTRHK